MTTDQPATSPVSMLPSFSTLEPRIWFQRAEIAFRLRNITDSTTKADHVLSAIPDAVFSRISTWLDHQPETLTYETVKTFLLKQFTLNTSQRAQKLLAFPQLTLGDRSAHAVWHEMQSLATLPEKDANGNYKEVDIMRELFIRTLPTAIRAALYDYDNLTMDQLVKRSDALLEAANAANAQNASIHTSRADISTVRTKPKLFKRVLPMILDSGLCTYHERFHNDARKCIEGCRLHPIRAPKSQQGSFTAQPTSLPTIQNADICQVTQSNSFHTISNNEVPKVFNAVHHHTPYSRHKEGKQHKAKTIGKQVSSKSRRLPTVKLNLARKTRRYSDANTHLQGELCSHDHTSNFMFNERCAHVT